MKSRGVADTRTAHVDHDCAWRAVSRISRVQLRRENGERLFILRGVLCKVMTDAV